VEAVRAAGDEDEVEAFGGQAAGEGGADAAGGSGDEGYGAGHLFVGGM